MPALVLPFPHKQSAATAPSLTHTMKLLFTRRTELSSFPEFQVTMQNMARRKLIPTPDVSSNCPTFKTSAVLTGFKVSISGRHL